jgi:hypothetical protein
MVIKIGLLIPLKSKNTSTLFLLNQNSVFLEENFQKADFMNPSMTWYLICNLPTPNL